MDILKYYLKRIGLTVAFVIGLIAIFIGVPLSAIWISDHFTAQQVFYVYCCFAGGVLIGVMWHLAGTLVDK